VDALKKMEKGQERLARENTLAGAQARQQRQEFSRRTIVVQQNGVLHKAMSESVQDARIRYRKLSLTRYVRFVYTGH
jgi:hypothetical protein